MPDCGVALIFSVRSVTSQALNLSRHMYQSSSPSPTPTLILNRTFSKPPHHFPSRQPPPMWDIIMLQLRVQASTCVGGRGGVTTHAAVKLRNAGQLGQAWRYCVVKTFPSPSISFPSAWQHAPRPAPPPALLRCAPVHTELGRAVSRVLGRVAWDGKWGQVSPALFQIYSGGECLECIGA